MKAEITEPLKGIFIINSKFLRNHAQLIALLVLGSSSDIFQFGILLEHSTNKMTCCIPVLALLAQNKFAHHRILSYSSRVPTIRHCMFIPLHFLELGAIIVLQTSKTEDLQLPSALQNN